MCEETTIGERQSNSFIMIYCVTTNKIINTQGKQLTHNQYKETRNMPQMGRARYLQAGSQNQPTIKRITEFEIIRKTFYGLIIQGNGKIVIRNFGQQNTGKK